MIYLNDVDAIKVDFENLLSDTKNGVLNQIKTLPNANKLSGSEFEQIVFDNAVEKAKNTQYKGHLRHTEDREFPDIVAAGYYGVEVKATKKDDWRSIGNSVLESSRVDSVQKIYMFFGKLGGIPDIKFRNYEDCLRGIAVTHYPRYQIDMQLDAAHSIFAKMGVSYDVIRKKDNPIGIIRAYYKKQLSEGDSLWWIDDDNDGMPELSPIIRNFSSLPTQAKDIIEARLLVFFPEVFSSSSKKYERIPAFLASQYGVVTPSLRDIFSAGGQVEYKYDKEVFKVPQVVAEMIRLAPFIKRSLSDKTQNQLSAYWQTDIINFTNAESAWANEIDRQSAHMQLPLKLSEIYQTLTSDNLINNSNSDKIES